MIFLSHRLSYWMRTRFLLWRRQRTVVATVTRGQRPSRRWLVLLVTLGISGVAVQWQVGADHRRPLELGLSLSEQAFAEAVTTAPARTAPEAEASHPVSTAAPVTNTVPSSDLAALVAVPGMSITESVSSRATPEACVSAPLRSVISDVSTDTTMTLDRAVVTTAGPPRHAGRVRRSHRRVARLAPPRGLTVMAVASRSALLRLPHGPPITVQSGTVVQGWTVHRFAPSGMVLTHHDQRMLVPVSLEIDQVR